MGHRSLMIGPLVLLMVGTAVAQQPAAAAQDAANGAPAPAPIMRLPMGLCFGLWNVSSPSQTDFDRSIDRCTARITTLIQSMRPPEDLACAYFGRGFAHAGQQDYARAILDYDEAIRLMPRYPHWYLYRGSAYRELRDYPRAIADFNEAIRQNRNFHSAFQNRADLYFSQGDLAHAVADYSEAIRLDPLNATYYRSRANAYRAQSDERRATADLNQWERLRALAGRLQALPYRGC